MTRPGFQTKPVARERRERTETIEGAAPAARPASADEREERIVGSVMGNLQSGLHPIWGFSLLRGTGRVGSFAWRFTWRFAWQFTCQFTWHKRARLPAPQP